MDFQQKKLEKELQELKKLIDVHFVQRKKVLEITKCYCVSFIGFLFQTLNNIIFYLKFLRTKKSSQLSRTESRREKSIELPN